MKQTGIKRVSISIITVLLLLAVLCASFSTLSLTVSAASSSNNEERFEVSGTNVDGNKALVLARLKSIERRINNLAKSEEEKASNAEKKYDGILKGKDEKKSNKDEAAKTWGNSFKAVKEQLPGLINIIKDLENGDDFDTAGTVKSLVSTTSSILSLCGPICGAIGSGLECAESITMMILGGSEASSELVQMEDRLDQQFDEIQNELDALEGLIKDLSDSINDSTNKIIEEMPAALERESDKQDVKKFLLRYEGNFSYNQFRNYLYGDTINNSNSTTAYYSWLQYALVNGESDDVVRRYYDDLYNAIVSDIDAFEEYLAPGDDNIKSIVKTYYDYLSSNPDFDSKYGMTPEEAAVQFAYELYQTERMADSLLLACTTYQYIQMLLNDQDNYKSYNDSFVVYKFQIEIDEMYSSIEARQNNVSEQLAKDMAYVMGLDNFYLVQEEDKQMYLIDDTTEAFGSVYPGQTIYLTPMSEAVCELFSFDKYAFTYEVISSSFEEWPDGYFKVNNNSPESIIVNLQYHGNTIQTTTYHTSETKDFAGGTGTYANPYLISTKEQFMLIANGLDKHYVLTRDIDLNGATITPFGCTSTSAGGEIIEEFTGTLDGNGHVVRNFNIEGRINTGLFATVGYNGTICNLSIVDAYIKANPTQAETTHSQFFIGTFAGENYGKIKNCSVSKSKEADKEIGVFFDLDNSAINRSIYVYAGGIAGINGNLISCCKVQNITVKANSDHSFGGESKDTNKNYVYAGGLVGCNNSLLGYSTVDASTAITATATSTFSPNNTVNPYVTGLAGGVCGKVDTPDYAYDMENLHSEAQTSGTADIELVDSRWGKHYRNRQQNAGNETNCYVPGWTDEQVQKICCTVDALAPVFVKNATQYHVEVENIKSSYLASDSSFDTTSMSISVTNRNNKELSYKVADYSVIGVYGFNPFNTSFEASIPDNAVILIEITLEDGNSFIISTNTSYTIGKNGIASIEIMQESKKFIADKNDSQILLSELNGDKNVVYNYLVGSENKAFDSEKFVDFSINTMRLIACEKCGSFDLSTVANASSVDYECQEEDCQHTGQAILQTFNYLYKGEVGHYIATITGKYDGVDAIFTLEYVVDCPHTVYEAEYLLPQNVIAPTCISVGYTQYECTECHVVIHQNYTSVTNEHQYKMNEDNIAPTCYKNGFSSAVICSICGHIKEASQVIPKLEHSYDEIIYIYDGSCIKLDTYGNKISEKHKCTNAEIDANGALVYHYENHQYKVTESVVPRTKISSGKEYVEYYVVYTYSCECGHSKVVPDENLIVEENSTLPTVIVSNGYAIHGTDEVVVYVQLLNNPGIAGANFGIRYDSRLQLKDFSDGTVISGSITSDSNEVNFGYNFVWANADYRSEDGNLLKLVFIVPEDAKLPTESAPGDIYNISVVYNIENGASGGFKEIGKNQPQCYITRDGTITMVKRLPGDVNNDGIVDLLDAVEISQFLVHKKDTIDETYANVDLSQGNPETNVNVSDLVAILQYLTGGYGTNLLAQEFQVTINGNGFDLGEADWLYVSIYNEYNNTYKEAGLKELEQRGYKFDGWWTKLVGGEQIILADGQLSNVKYYDYQKTQMLYAHWTLNSVTLNGNGNTNDIEVPKVGFTEDYQPGKIDSPYVQEYTVIFTDSSQKGKFSNVEKTLKYTLRGWALSKEDADNGKYTYLPDLSDLDLSVANLGELELFAVWDNGSLEYPTWDKHELGYQSIQWYANAELTTLLDILNEQVSNAIVKSNALASGNKTSVYADFEPIRYTIYFDANGGDGSKLPENNHNVEEENALSPNITITRTGWEFIGWALTPNGDVVYNDEHSVGYVPTPELQNDGSYAITLYAKWAPKEYTITFDANGGSVGLTSKKILSGQNYGDLPVPERKGFRFIGWYTDYSDGTEITKNTVMSAADNQVLFAHWQSEVVYTLGNDGTYSVTGINYDDIANLIILSEYSPNGYVTPLPVTSISNAAFLNCSQLRSVVIPNTVTSIGYNAFGKCVNLNSITLPFVGATLNGAANTHFGYIFGASSYSSNTDYVPEALKTVVVTKATNYGESAFYSCKTIESITLPEGTTSISDNLFKYCSVLTNFNIPTTVTNIGVGAFQACLGLKKIEIPSQVKSLGESSFMFCTNLESVNFLPGVTNIGDDAFYGCSKLSNVKLPTTLTNIGYYSFGECTALTSIDLPATVIGIGEWAFRDSGLKTVNFSANSQMKTLGISAFEFCPNLTSINLPASLTTIGDWAFGDCTSLVHISIPDNVTDIGYGAFSGCSSMTTFSWPSRITEIKNGMFEDCTSLSSFYVPSGVKSIGQVVFRDCTALKRIDLPKSVTSIDYQAFSGCTALEVAYYEGKPSEWNSITFGDGNDILKSKVSCKESDSCFTGDTLVVLGDGSIARIDSLKQGDIVMSWNAFTGQFEPMPISMFWNHGEQEYDVITLQFSNEKIVKVVTDHGFFDATLNKYVYIDANNVEEFIGHEFAHMTASGDWENVILVDAKVSREISSCYSFRTACNDNAIVEGFLTLTHEDINGLLTYFEFGDNYMYDEEKMRADIEEYGLYSYDDWKDYVSYEEFVALNGQYLTIVIGKGYMTFEDILCLISGMR